MRPFWWLIVCASNIYNIEKLRKISLTSCWLKIRADRMCRRYGNKKGDFVMWRDDTRFLWIRFPGRNRRHEFFPFYFLLDLPFEFSLFVGLINWINRIEKLQFSYSPQKNVTRKVTFKSSIFPKYFCYLELVFTFILFHVRDSWSSWRQH
jgi:hypothetical protein